MTQWPDGGRNVQDEGPEHFVVSDEILERILNELSGVQYKYQAELCSKLTLLILWCTHETRHYFSSYEIAHLITQLGFKDVDKKNISLAMSKLLASPLSRLIHVKRVLRNRVVCNAIKLISNLRGVDLEELFELHESKKNGLDNLQLKHGLVLLPPINNRYIADIMVDADIDEGGRLVSDAHFKIIVVRTDEQPITKPTPKKAKVEYPTGVEAEISKFKTKIKLMYGFDLDFE